MDNMKFHIIHPSIEELYVNALVLHILQEQLGQIGPQGMTTEIQTQVDEAASNFVISAKRAEELFGNSNNVQLQLDAFSIQRSGDA